MEPGHLLIHPLLFFTLHHSNYQGFSWLSVLPLGVFPLLQCALKCLGWATWVLWVTAVALCHCLGWWQMYQACFSPKSPSYDLLRNLTYNLRLRALSSKRFQIDGCLGYIVKGSMHHPSVHWHAVMMASWQRARPRGTGTWKEHLLTRGRCGWSVGRELCQQRRPGMVTWDEAEREGRAREWMMKMGGEDGCPQRSASWLCLE